MTHPDAIPPDRGSVPARLEFLDGCRALAVLGMLFANMMNVFLRRVPHLLAHNEGNRLRAFDFPAPVFQFLIGVSLVLFLEKRESRGLTARHAQRIALRRFALLVALGIVLDGIGALRWSPQWGVLQTLGLGGAVATGFAGVSDPLVTAAAFALLAVFSGPMNGEVHHDPIAALAFVPLTLAGLVAGRGLVGASRARFGKRSLGIVAAGLVVAAGTRGAGIPFNKILGTSSFVALAAALSALALLAMAALADAGVRYPRWLLAVGSNALMAWVLQYVLVYYPAWLIFPEWHRLRFLPGMTAALAALTLLAWLTAALARRDIRIPI